VKLVIIFPTGMAKVKDFSPEDSLHCMCGELERIAEEEAMTCFKVLFKISPGMAK
jgi:hypothetical protein